MALTQTGTTRIVGSGGTLGGAFPGSDVVRWTLTHTPADIKEVSVAGLVTTIIQGDGETVELSCDVVFQAVATAALPAPGTNCSLSTFAIITVGGFTDVLNAGGGKWRYMGGTATAVTDGEATGTVNFKKWKGITLA
jgi:hypothetical protein